MATEALSLNNFRESVFALMPARTRLIAAWFDVYLNAISISTPVTTATNVADSQPGSALMGASTTSPTASATELSQAITRVRTLIIRYIPDREAGRQLDSRLRPF